MASSLGSEDRLDRGGSHSPGAGSSPRPAGSKDSPGYSTINSPHFTKAESKSFSAAAARSHDQIPRSHDLQKSSSQRSGDQSPPEQPQRSLDHIPRSHDLLPRTDFLKTCLSSGKGSGGGTNVLDRMAAHSRTIKTLQSATTHTQQQNYPQIPAKPLLKNQSSTSSNQSAASSSLNRVAPHPSSSLTHPDAAFFPSSASSSSARSFNQSGAGTGSSQQRVDFHGPESPKSPPPPVADSEQPSTNQTTAGSPRSPVAGGCQQETFFPSNHSSPSHTVSALATMPRRKKRITVLQEKSPGKYYPGEAQTVDRRLLYKPQKPPTPPLRRLPSWESRIYAIANVGLRLPDNGNLANRESAVPVVTAAAAGLYGGDSAGGGVYRDLAVPVFTTIKGRAAQIRSTPFSGESSSESDESDEDVTMATWSPGDSDDTAAAAKTATKRGSRHSMCSSLASETSSDYALPPDDDVSLATDSSGDSEPEHKLLKYTAATAGGGEAKDSLEKCGYLTKLGGRMKSWRRRWFELKQGQLLYYKSPNDIARRPQGHIAMDTQTRINKIDGTLTFEVATSKRTYYLGIAATDNPDELDHWIRVLQNVLKKQTADLVLSNSKSKETMKGWLIKTKNGRSRRVWCLLLGRLFMYYRNPQDKTPLGQIHLRSARVEEVDRSCDSESDSDDTAVPDYTIAIWPAGGNGAGPTYLMIPTKHEKDSWQYHLTVASGGGTGHVGTEYEQIVAKLMEADGDPNSVYWQHPALLHSKEPLTAPLTTLPSEDLQHRALELFKQVQLFTCLPLDPAGSVEQHVAVAQAVLAACLHHPQLQTELYCQLIKQTSRHPPATQAKSGVQTLLCGSHHWFLCDSAAAAGSPTSPTNSLMDLSSPGDNKLNPQHHVLVQGWQLLALTLSLFLPRQSILWLLKAHLTWNTHPRTEVGKYAVFCQRSLDRALQHGGSAGREARPSRMEVLSILLRNPYNHSQPLSIPVHFLNGTYQVVSFDGCTPVSEFLCSLTAALGMRDVALSGFALFTDDPAGQEVEHCLRGHIKLCDVISKWEEAYLQHARQTQRPPEARTVTLTFKNRLCLRSWWRGETEREKLLLAYQVSEEVVNGRFPLNRDLAVELAALMAQIEFGDLRLPGETTSTLPRSPAHRSTSAAPPDSSLGAVMQRFYPRRYRHISHAETSYVERRVADKWLALRGRTQTDCVRIYLTVARKWSFFGAKLFSARMRRGSHSDPLAVWLAVQEDAVSVLDFATLKPVSSHELRNVVTFGGCRDDFMLVVNERVADGADPGVAAGSQRGRTTRSLFIMTKPKILEVTLLLASYINHRAAGGGQRSTATGPRHPATSGGSSVHV